MLCPVSLCKIIFNRKWDCSLKFHRWHGQLRIATFRVSLVLKFCENNQVQTVVLVSKFCENNQVQIVVFISKCSAQTSAKNMSYKPATTSGQVSL